MQNFLCCFSVQKQKRAIPYAALKGNLVFSYKLRLFTDHIINRCPQVSLCHDNFGRQDPGREAAILLQQQ